MRPHRAVYEAIYGRGHQAKNWKNPASAPLCIWWRGDGPRPLGPSLFGCNMLQRVGAGCFSTDVGYSDHGQDVHGARLTISSGSSAPQSAPSALVLSANSASHHALIGRHTFACLGCLAEEAF